MESLSVRQRSMLLAKLQAQHQCLICKQFGSIADGGVKCHFCNVFFHLVCIDPLRSTPLASSYNAENPTAVIWACEDCASDIDRSDSDDSSYMDSDCSDDAMSVPHAAEVVDDVLDSLDKHPCDCMCGDCSTGSDDSETRAEEEEILHGESVREIEQLTAKVQRGEKIWTKSECPCEVRVTAVQSTAYARRFVARPTRPLIPWFGSRLSLVHATIAMETRCFVPRLLRWRLPRALSIAFSSKSRLAQARRPLAWTRFTNEVTFS